MGTMAAEGRSMSADDPSRDETTFEYSRQLGQRLRAARSARRLSLRDIEEASHEEFKASMVGAYERGERTISVYRLNRLARMYGLTVEALLAVPASAGTSLSVTGTDEALVIDLMALERLPPEARQLVESYLLLIRLQRESRDDVILIRRSDAQALARLAGDDAIIGTVHR
jgi:transcriptional regulator with XRE-family HTH domain